MGMAFVSLWPLTFRASDSEMATVILRYGKVIYRGVLPELSLQHLQRKCNDYTSNTAAWFEVLLFKWAPEGMMNGRGCVNFL